MKPSIVFVLTTAAALLGCGDDDGTPTPDASTEEDAGPLSCDAPDSVCPEDAPYPNGRCVGALDCTYDSPMLPGPDDWTFQCVDGAWQEMLLCGGCAPQTYEACRTPIDTGMAGARVTSGITDGATLVPVFGGQGGAMIMHTVNVDGLDDRRCVEVRQRVTLEGIPAEITIPVRLRCGRSAPMFAILPDRPCEFRDYAATLELEVLGAGSETLDLTITGGSCPRTLGPDAGDAPPDAGP
jgi:hypothetical protein